MANKKNIFESTNMKSTHYAERIFDAVADTEVENGTFGFLQELVDGESVIYKFVAGVKASEQIVVVDQPAWSEDTSRITNQRRDKFSVPAGVPFRVRVVAKGDVFATAIEGVTTASADAMQKDAFVTIDNATGKLVAKATTTADAQFEGIVEKERMVGGTLSTVAHNYGYATKLYEVRIKTLV